MIFPKDQPLPTPTPTSASVISDEDVAIQLMRLTDPLATPLLSPSILSNEEDHHEQMSPPNIPTTTTVQSSHSRCTRCIASKKGCDRKRPCSRCIQQGFEEEDCVSDDEKGSARKRVAVLRRMGRNGGGKAGKK